MDEHTEEGRDRRDGDSRARLSILIMRRRAFGDSCGLLGVRCGIEKEDTTSLRIGHMSKPSLLWGGVLTSK